MILFNIYIIVAIILFLMANLYSQANGNSSFRVQFYVTICSLFWPVWTLSFALIAIALAIYCWVDNRWHS